MRRLRAAMVLAGALALAGALTATHRAAGQGPDPERPNVVVVMTDDQTQASLEKLPTVQSELAARGASFANSFTNWPLCCPSRATFYTGQYAHNHGVLGNQPPDGGFARLDDANTLPVWLQAAGYRTIHVGKYLNGYGQDASDPAYVPPGWDEWNAATAGTTQSVYDYILNRNGSLVGYGSAPSDFKQDVFSDLAVEAINRNAPGGPFFLGVMYTAPHSGGPNPNPHPPADCAASAKPAPRHAGAFDSEPLPQPPSFNEADVSDKPAAVRDQASITPAEAAAIQRKYRCRLESLLSVDDGVGRMLDALAAAGERDETVFVFTADNGFFHGEHRVQTGKNRVYEEATRVPLVIRGPGVPEGVTVDDLAVNADLAPTALDAAGASAGLAEDGRSLLPFAAHPSRFHGRELLFEKGNVLDGDDDPTPQSGTFAAVRTSRYVYVENLTGELELYDLDLDPFQLQNQVANPAYDAAEAALAARLAALRSCAGKSCRSKPDLRLKLPRPVREGGRSCRQASGFVVRVRGADAGELVLASFAVGSAKAVTDRAGPFKKRLLPRQLRAKRRPEIRAEVELVDGRRLSLRQRVRICR
jgi:N-acetylglucosamine-6-sulfatase